MPQANDPRKDDMPKKDFDKENMVKASASHRSRSARGDARRNMPRVMIVGLLVVVAGGAALFWPRGGSVPSGIGEQQTVVTAPDTSAAGHVPPHSSEVDINAEAAPTITPEKPAGNQTEGAGSTMDKATGGDSAPTPSATPQTTKPETTKPKATTPKATTPKATTPPPTKAIQPGPSGRYVVQVGAFGSAENADAEAARLKARGWDTRVRANNNARGEMIFQVHITYFASRSEAETFIKQNSKHLPGAFAKHK